MDVQSRRIVLDTPTFFKNRTSTGIVTLTIFRFFVAQNSGTPWCPEVKHSLLDTLSLGVTKLIPRQVTTFCVPHSARTDRYVQHLPSVSFKKTETSLAAGLPKPVTGTHVLHASESATFNAQL